VNLGQSELTWSTEASVLPYFHKKTQKASGF